MVTNCCNYYKDCKNILRKNEREMQQYEEL